MVQIPEQPNFPVLIIHFLTSLGVKERASAVECASIERSAEQANKWSKRTDEQEAPIPGCSESLWVG